MKPSLGWVIQDVSNDAKIFQYSASASMMAAIVVPDIVVLDGDLGLDGFGWDLIPKIRRRWKNARLIGWSDYKDPDDNRITAKEEFAKAQVDAYSNKSYDEKDWAELLS
jgi:hypothetical protein